MLVTIFLYITKAKREIKENIFTKMKQEPEPKVDEMSGFDSSDEENDYDLTPLEISWLDLSFANGDGKVGICSLPGCRFRDTWRSLENDIKCMKTEGVTDVLCLCSKGELIKYRVPWLLNEYAAVDINIHHYPFPDGLTPSMSVLMKMIDQLNVNIKNSKTSVIHCYGGLGRSSLVAACLMMVLDTSLEPSSAIEIMRSVRGHSAVQSVKQYNFIHDFPDMLDAHSKEEDEAKRSVSR